jgi:hypothetical protein
LGRRKEMADRKIMFGILDKMGVEYTHKISMERTKKKLDRNLQKLGVPTGLNTVERAELKELFGMDIPEPKPVKIILRTKGQKIGAMSHRFKRLWKEKDGWTREEIKNELAKAHTKNPRMAAYNYIALAKKNPKILGGLLIETKIKDGPSIISLSKQK